MRGFLYLALLPVIYSSYDGLLTNRRFVNYWQQCQEWLSIKITNIDLTTFKLQIQTRPESKKNCHLYQRMSWQKVKLIFFF